MATPPTLVAASVVTTASGNFSNPALVSASLTVQSDDVVSFIALGEGSVAGNAFGTPTTTLTGGAIAVLKTHAAASDSEAGAWAFTATAGGTGTVTVPHTAANGGSGAVLVVTVHRNAVAPTSARSSLGTGTSRTLSYTPSQADSAILWGVADWAAAAVQSVTPTSTSHTATSPGPSALPESAQTTPLTQYAAVLDDQTSTGAVSYGISGTGTGPFVILVVEIQGTSSAPDITTIPTYQTVTMAAAGTAANVTVAATTLNIPYPAGITAGDVLVWYASTSAAVSAIPSGWTALQGTGLYSTTSQFGAAAYKIATGSESGSLAVTMASATAHGRMFRFTGVDQTTPLDVAGTQVAVNAAAIAMTSITTVTPGAMVLALGGHANTTNTYTQTAGSPTMTEQDDAAQAGGAGRAAAFYSATLAAAGATGAVTLTGTAAVRGLGVLAALRPAVNAASIRVRRVSRWR